MRFNTNYARFDILTAVLTEKIQVLWNVAPYHIQGHGEAVGQFNLDPENQGITIFRRRQ